MKQVKIGGITYDIEYKNVIDTDGDLNNFGTCDFREAKLEISTLPNKQRQEQTLIHEITHAIFYEAGIELENEEDIVNRVSMVLYQVLKDNELNFKEKTANKKILDAIANAQRNIEASHRMNIYGNYS